MSLSLSRKQNDKTNTEALAFSRGKVGLFGDTLGPNGRFVCPKPAPVVWKT